MQVKEYRTLGELEREIDKRESEIHAELSMQESMQKIGFISQAENLKHKIFRQHEEIEYLKELYKKMKFKLHGTGKS